MGSPMEVGWLENLACVDMQQCSHLPVPYHLRHTSGIFKKDRLRVKGVDDKGVITRGAARMIEWKWNWEGCKYPLAALRKL